MAMIGSSFKESCWDQPFDKNYFKPYFIKTIEVEIQAVALVLETSPSSELEHYKLGLERALELVKKV